MPSPDTPLREGQLLRPVDLPALIRALREHTGLSTDQVAHQASLSPAAVREAESHPHRARFKTRRRLLERFAGFTLEGPFYRVVRKKTS